MKDFSLDDQLKMLATEAVRALTAREETVAFAESCTGGLLAKTMTDVSGASAVLECGVVAYSERIKKQLLGVSQQTLDRYSVVSAETATEMAEGVRTLAGATYGIGITGVAGPGPDGNHPEGEIYIALADGTDTRTFAMDTRTENQRTRNRKTAAVHALELLLQRIDGGSNGQ